MAKVMVEFDTVEKTMSATIDGKAVENCYEISFGKYGDDEFGCSIGIRTEDKSNKMMKNERIYASKSKEANSLSATKASSFDGFITENSDLNSNINKYFFGEK